jgi:dephospho-CoA kinase
MIVIGIVGGIGSGKSLVARAMQELGGYLIQADQLGHAALEQPDVKSQLVARWGDSVLDDQETADRKQIGRRKIGDHQTDKDHDQWSEPYIDLKVRQKPRRRVNKSLRHPADLKTKTPDLAKRIRVGVIKYQPQDHKRQKGEEQAPAHKPNDRIYS